MVITFAAWPVASQQVGIMNSARLQGPTGLFLASLREVFFGFAIGFSTKLVLIAASIAANMIGLNMGFQTAATFSPIFNSQDSAFAVFKNWIVKSFRKYVYKRNKQSLKIENSNQGV
jgi:flagellar biosynthesis protein FliR